ncbi:MAG: cytochrome c3 family protein [Desulfobacteraceae bacterium]|nr:cytochrome c3 family protein [Desulfobacteraceae bacterium]
MSAGSGRRPGEPGHPEYRPAHERERVRIHPPGEPSSKRAESYRDSPVRFGWRLTGFLAVLLTVGLMIGVYHASFRTRIGPAQPIPFSHRIHAGVKSISCLFCHNQAAESARAGIPPVETCMLCHSRIIVTYPPIERVRRHYAERAPIIWKKVTKLPEYVYFNHSVHLHRGIDCGKCHGDVAAMDRIEQVQDLVMGFCITCHRETGATHDCFTCHR